MKTSWNLLADISHTCRKHLIHKHQRNFSLRRSNKIRLQWYCSVPRTIFGGHPTDSLHWSCNLVLLECSRLEFWDSHSSTLLSYQRKCRAENSIHLSLFKLTYAIRIPQFSVETKYEDTTWLLQCWDSSLFQEFYHICWVILRRYFWWYTFFLLQSSVYTLLDY